MEEKRLHTRHSATYKVVYSVEGTTRTVATNSLDVSFGGIGIAVKGVLKTSCKIKLSIHCSALNKPLEANGRLIWQDNSPGTDVQRAGIQFTDAPYTQLKDLLAQAA